MGQKDTIYKEQKDTFYRGQKDTFYKGHFKDIKLKIILAVNFFTMQYSQFHLIWLSGFREKVRTELQRIRHLSIII